MHRTLSANFSSYLDPTYGACYKFNAPNGSDFQVYRSGSRFGLRLLLVVEVYEYPTFESY